MLAPLPQADEREWGIHQRHPKTIDQKDLGIMGESEGPARSFFLQWSEDASRGKKEEEAKKASGSLPFFPLFFLGRPKKEEEEEEDQLVTLKDPQRKEATAGGGGDIRRDEVAPKTLLTRNEKTLEPQKSWANLGSLRPQGLISRLPAPPLLFPTFF